MRRARGGWWRMLRADQLCICLIAFLHLCHAEDVTCTVTRHAGQTRYSVPEFTANDCHYRWTNSTNHVLANHEGEIEGLVVMKSNRMLLTNECSEVVHYLRDCISEGTPREANCTRDCSENAEHQKNGGEISRNHWIVFLLLLQLFLC